MRMKRFVKRKKNAGVPLFLNVYDLTPMNGYLYWFGLGIYHSAIEAHGIEYAFGAHDFPSSGVFEVEPRSCPGFRFRKSIKLGTIQLNPTEFREFMVQIASEYNGDTYHLMLKNCNHFCNDVSTRLTGSSIPGWVNRLATLGTLCNCLLPDSLNVSTVQIPENDTKPHCLTNAKCMHMPDDPLAIPTRTEKRHLSIWQPLRGRVLPWNWKQSTSMDQKFKHL